MAAGAPSDPLASQGSLVTAEHGRILLAVNAGSDTVSLFTVRGDHLTLRRVISSGGSFPASIAVRGDLVYVMNAGGAGELRGYWLSGDRLYPIGNSGRSLGLANATPPNFLTSPGQVGFSPDGSRLVVTTKASGSTIDVWRVRYNGRLSDDPVKTTSTSPVPFAFTFDRQGRLLSIEAAMGQLSTYSLKHDETLVGIGTTTSNGQTALCWIAFARGFYYGTNTGSNTISSFRVAHDGTPTLVAAVAATTDAGPTDMAVSADQRYLYVQGGAAGSVDVFRVGSNGSRRRSRPSRACRRSSRGSRRATERSPTRTRSPSWRSGLQAGPPQADRAWTGGRRTLEDAQRQPPTPSRGVGQPRGG